MQIFAQWCAIDSVMHFSVSKVTVTLKFIFNTVVYFPYPTCW